MTGMNEDLIPGEPTIQNFIVIVYNNDNDPPTEQGVGPFYSKPEYEHWIGQNLKNKNCTTKIYGVRLPYENLDKPLV